MIDFVVLILLFIPWTVWVIHLLRKIKRLERELADRPVGRVISTTLTEEGLLVKGEIFGKGVLEKMAQDMVGMSIGYKLEDEHRPPVAPPYNYGVDHAKLYRVDDIDRDVELPFETSEDYSALFHHSMIDFVWSPEEIDFVWPPEKKEE